MDQNLERFRDEESCWRDRAVFTPRLQVRAFRPEDSADLYEYLSNPAIYQFEPGEPVDHQRAQEIAVEFASSTDFWAVELLAEHKVIGQIYFQHIEPAHLMTWELGYILSPRYQRQGYASEAASSLVRCGFAAAGIHRVVAHCNPANVASWKLLEKTGFRREGLFRKNIFFRHNADGIPLWNDSYAYAVLAEESIGNPVI